MLGMMIIFAQSRVAIDARADNNEDVDERIQNLNDKARTLPKSPGVYLMKDDKGRVIYIGKASSLRDRVCSYFQASTKLENLKSEMIQHVVDFEILQTDSEVEALLAENRLIKDIQPRFNVRLVDDKTYPYLMVTLDDDYPGVYVTREPRTEGVKLYGPFTSVYQLKEAVQHLQRAFKFRTCHLEILESDSRKKFFRPCLLYAINQCTAPCADKIPRDSYNEDVRRLIQFLDGDRKAVLRDLEKEMKHASESMHFERAAKLRDEIKALNALGNRAGKGTEQFWQPEAFVTHPQEGVAKLQEILGLAEPPRIIEAIDIAHLQGGETVGSKVCFIDGVPFKDGYRRYKIKHDLGNNDYLSIQEVVSRRYREAGQNNELYPDVIVIDGGLGQLHAAMEVFKTMDVRPPMVISLAKKEELIYAQEKSAPIRLGRNHQGLKLLQYIRDEAHRFAQHYHHILRRKSQLEEDVKKGRRPPRAKKAGTKPFGQLTPLPTDAQGMEQPQPMAPLPPVMPETEAAAQGIQETHVRPPEGASGSGPSENN